VLENAQPKLHSKLCFGPWRLYCRQIQLRIDTGDLQSQEALVRQPFGISSNRYRVEVRPRCGGKVFVIFCD
jgi:hypothetical protein